MPVWEASFCQKSSKSVNLVHTLVSKEKRNGDKFKYITGEIKKIVITFFVLCRCVGLTSKTVLRVASIRKVGHVAVLVHSETVAAALLFEKAALVEILLLDQLAHRHPLEELHGGVADGDPPFLPVSNLRNIDKFTVPYRTYEFSENLSRSNQKLNK